MGPVSVSSASQIAVSSMRLCVVSCALPEISRTVPGCSISTAQPPRPCIPFALQLPSVQTTVFTPDSLLSAGPEATPIFMHRPGLPEGQAPGDIPARWAMPPRRRAGVRAPRHESHRVRRCAQRPRSGGERGVQLGERLEPALLTGGRQMLREPLADLESSPSVGLVVELESDPRLERLEALGKLSGDVHGAIEQLAVDDLHEVEVDVDPNAGIVCKD